jgi:hypothetical protein
VPPPSHEEAEQVGYQFMLDVVAAAPSNSDEEAAQRIFETLSSSAREGKSVDTIASDMALFVGIQDVPDEGVSVEDLQIKSPTEAVLTLGLNYSGGRVLRDIHLVVEDMMWKVDSVSVPNESI